MNRIIKLLTVLTLTVILLVTGCSSKQTTGVVSETSTEIGSYPNSELPQSTKPVASSTESSAVQTVQSSSSFPQSTKDAENSSESSKPESEPIVRTEYKFRNQKLLDQHYEKHGRDMGFASAEEYEKAAAAVPNNPEVLHKTEKEDGDDVYYVESTNEFVVVSTDGYIRTYFNPDRGIDYYNKQ